VVVLEFVRRTGRFSAQPQGQNLGHSGKNFFTKILVFIGFPLAQWHIRKPFIPTRRR
jgi:hypothetical protein